MYSVQEGINKKFNHYESSTNRYTCTCGRNEWIIPVVLNHCVIAYPLENIFCFTYSLALSFNSLLSKHETQMSFQTNSLFKKHHLLVNLGISWYLRLVLSWYLRLMLSIIYTHVPLARPSRTLI